MRVQEKEPRLAAVHAGALDGATGFRGGLVEALGREAADVAEDGLLTELESTLAFESVRSHQSGGLLCTTCFQVKRIDDHYNHDYDDRSHDHDHGVSQRH